MRTRMMFMSAVVVCGLSACPPSGAVGVVQDSGSSASDVAKQRINAPASLELAKQRINRPTNVG